MRGAVVMVATVEEVKVFEAFKIALLDGSGVDCPAQVV